MSPVDADPSRPSPGLLPFLRPSEMADRLRAVDWAATPLGPVAGWPQSLRAAVGICLNSRFPMFVWWGDERINIYNDAYVPIMGGRHPAGFRRPARESWGEIWDVVGKQADEVFDNGSATWNERVHLQVSRHGYAEDAWFTWSYSPIPGDAGGIDGLFCAVTEDTARVLAEREWVRSDERRRDAQEELTRLAETHAEQARRHEQMLSSIKDFAYTFDLDGRFTYANKPLLDLLDRQADEIVGMDFFDLGYPDELAARHREEIQQVIRTGRTLAAESVFTAPNGLTASYQYIFAPVIGEDGRVEAVAGSTRDITTRKRLETELSRTVSDLHAERANLAGIIEHAPAFICVLRGPDHVFELANDRYFDLVGHRRLLGRSVRDATPEGAQQRLFEELDRVYRTGEPFVASEMPIRLDRDGGAEERFVSFVYQALRDADGTVSGVFVHGVDVTDLVRTREAARESEARYRTLFDSVDQGFCIAQVVLDDAGEPADYRILEANPAFERLTGLAGGGERTVLELVPGLERWWVETYGRVALTGEATRFENYAAPMGKWFEVYAFRFEGPSDLQVAIFFSDITERKAAAEALRESEGRFRNMADNAPVMMWVTGPDGRCEYLNRAWYEFTGQDTGRGDGFGWLEAVHPDDAEQVRETFLAANEARRAFRLKFRLRRRDGVYRWAIDSAAPRYSDEGTWLGYVGSVSDVTDLEDARRVLEEHNTLLEQTVRERTAELEDSHRKLRLSERMAALGTLSAGLGHDMGNLLLPVRIRLDSLAAADLPQELRDDVEGIRTSAEYLRRLSSGLRMLSLDPERAARSESTELAAWWDEAGPMLRNVLPRGVELVSKLPDTPCRVGISRPAITQAVFNLVQNAGDAMRTRGRGSVTVWAERAGGEVHVGVSDDGPGMDPDVQSRCMEPFFTTKTREISTGLGLALVYGLTREVGGSVDIRSTPGAGTTFVLRLPAADQDGTDAGRKRAAGTALVDIAEPRLRAIAAAELRSLGFEIRGGSDGAAATLAVVDDPAKAGAISADRPVVVVGPAIEDADGRTLATGDKPSSRVLRDAIRRAAGRDSKREDRS